MNINEIMSDFLELKKKGIILKDFSTFDDLLDVLSEMFRDEYDVMYVPDAQKAYNTLDNITNGLLTKHSGTYSTGTVDWEVCYDDYFRNSIELYLAMWNSCHSTEINNVGDLCDSIYTRIIKDMAIIGCDNENMLSKIEKEVFNSTATPFYIECGDTDFRIKFKEEKLEMNKKEIKNNYDDKILDIIVQIAETEDVDEAIKLIEYKKELEVIRDRLVKDILNGKA